MTAAALSTQRQVPVERARTLTATVRKEMLDQYRLGKKCSKDEIHRAWKYFGLSGSGWDLARRGTSATLAMNDGSRNTIERWR